MIVLNAENDSPYLVLRVCENGSQWFSCFGAHQLCISRKGSAVVFKRWSRSLDTSKEWAVFNFITWEELVIFYCTFVALKARSTQTVKISPHEIKLRGEKRLFQAQIKDDGYFHSLIVYEDRMTHGIRLHAAVWEGELRQCPVWTAFVTHISTSPTWLRRRGKHKVALKEIQLYVFCDRYQEDNMRRNKSGAFEIHFVVEEAATRFVEVFYPPPALEGPEPAAAIAGPEPEPEAHP